MERGGGQQWRAMEDCSTDERLQQKKTLCHWQWTDEYVERRMRQNVIVVVICTNRLGVYEQLNQAIFITPEASTETHFY